MPTDFAAYHIYGAAVLAPCDDTVLRTHDGHYETPIGEGVTEDVAGNMVALQCDTATVVLAHLQARVQVTKGQAVTRGTILGRVGSTGNSTEPHLHIHAVDRQAEDVNCLLFTCEGLPISFTRRTAAATRAAALADPDGVARTSEAIEAFWDWVELLAQQNASPTLECKTDYEHRNPYYPTGPKAVR